MLFIRHIASLLVITARGVHVSRQSNPVRIRTASMTRPHLLFAPQKSRTFHNMTFCEASKSRSLKWGSRVQCQALCLLRIGGGGGWVGDLQRRRGDTSAVLRPRTLHGTKELKGKLSQCPVHCGYRNKIQQPPDVSLKYWGASFRTLPPSGIFSDRVQVPNASFGAFTAVMFQVEIFW